MPTVPDPPPPDWDSLEFDEAQKLTVNGHDGTNDAFKDSTGKAIYLYVGKAATAGRVAWYLRDVAYAGNCPQVKVPQATFNVIKDGTLNTQTSRIAVGATTYELRLHRSGSDLVAAAVVV